MVWSPDEKFAKKVIGKSKQQQYEGRKHSRSNSQVEEWRENNRGSDRKNSQNITQTIGFPFYFLYKLSSGIVTG